MHEKFGEATEATHSSITQTDAFDDKHGIVFPSSYPQERPGSLCKPFDANVIGFLSAILNTGLFYHDNLQSQLPGYYDRVVTILLSSTEGGLNLDMTPETIEQIAIKGYWAGDAVVKRFNLAHHQWVRLRVLLNELEQQLIPLHESLQKHKGLADAADLDTLLNTIGTFLQRHQLDINIVQHLIETEISAYSTEDQRFPYARDTHWRNAALPRLYLLLLLIEAWGGDETARFQLTHPTLPRDKVQDTDHMRLRVTPDL
jgi:hypothetical protein